MNEYDIAVIGGGASGLMAAVTAAKTAKSKIKIVILEGNKKQGKKLLATGNGRCNLTNTDFSSCKYFGDTELLSDFFKCYTPQKIMAEFAEMGVLTVSDQEGRVYPNNKQALAVLEILKNQCAVNGVDCLLEFNCFSVIKSGKNFVLKSSDGREIKAKRCILATGGKASPKHSSSLDGYKIAESLGHKISKTYPALVQLTTNDKFIKNLSGIRSAVKVSLVGDNKIISTENGEMLFADKAVSGICIFQLSLYASEYFYLGSIGGKKYKKLTLAVDFLPAKTEDELYYFLAGYIKNNPMVLCGDLLSGVLNIKVGREIVRVCGIDTLSAVSTLDDKAIRKISSKVKNLSINISGTKDFADAQITAGGVNLSEINTASFESRLVKGLYFCGEILSVHGMCGGYNLQFAWSSGMAAGIGAAQNIEENGK